MNEKRPNKALGRGLGALIKDKEKMGKPRHVEEEERRAKNMEFYRSLVKQYVQTGERDILTEQLLNDIRIHLNISDKEHLHLIQTLRKREQQLPPTSEETKDQIQKEIKQEMKQLLKDIKKEELSSGEKTTKKKVLVSFEDDEKPRVLKIPQEKPPKKAMGSEKEVDWPGEPRVVKKKLKRKVLKKETVEGPPVIQKEKAVQTKVEWDEGLEYGKEPIKAMAPKPGMEEGTTPISAPAPKHGMKESSQPIAVEPSTIETPVEEVPMGVIVENGRSGPVQSFVDQSTSTHVASEDLEEVPTEPAEEKVMAVELEAPSEPEGRIEEGPEEPDVLDIAEEEELEAEEEVEEEELEEEEEELKEEAEEEIEEMEEEEEEIEVLEDSLISIKILMEEGKLHKAFDMSRRILEKEPGNVGVLNECGVLLYKLDNISGAYDCYRKAMEIGEPSTETMINYALILAEMGELDASLSTLNAAIDKDPYSEDGWNNKAVVLFRAGRMREALTCLDEALRINDRSIETWINTGIIFEKMGEFGPAMECYQTVLELDPENPLAKEGVDYCGSQV